MISVEEIEPQEAAPEEVPAPEPKVIEEEPAAPEAEPSVVDFQDVPPLEAAPKKRGRPKAAPKEKPVPKAKGRPRKVVVPEEPVEEVQHYVPAPTDDQLHEYVTPLLRLYASHLMRGREGKRAHYRNIFSRM